MLNNYTMFGNPKSMSGGGGGLGANSNSNESSFTIICYTCGMPSSRDWAQLVQTHFTSPGKPFFPFILNMIPTNGAQIREDGSVFLCAFCNASLESQWPITIPFGNKNGNQKEIISLISSSPSSSSLLLMKNNPEGLLSLFANKKYDISKFICAICSVETYRKRVRALPFQEFPFLETSRQPGSLTLGNHPLAIVCLDCSETLWAQSAEYDRWGLPVHKRHFNWMARPPPPPDSVESTVARLPSGETQLPRCPPIEPNIVFNNSAPAVTSINVNKIQKPKFPQPHFISSQPQSQPMKPQSNNHMISNQNNMTSIQNQNQGQLQKGVIIGIGKGQSPTHQPNHHQQIIKQALPVVTVAPTIITHSSSYLLPKSMETIPSSTLSLTSSNSHYPLLPPPPLTSLSPNTSSTPSPSSTYSYFPHIFTSPPSLLYSSPSTSNSHLSNQNHLRPFLFPFPPSHFGSFNSNTNVPPSSHSPENYRDRVPASISPSNSTYTSANQSHIMFTNSNKAPFYHPLSSANHNQSQSQTKKSANSLLTRTNSNSNINLEGNSNSNSVLSLNASVSKRPLVRAKSKEELYTAREIQKESEKRKRKSFSISTAPPIIINENEDDSYNDNDNSGSNKSESENEVLNSPTVPENWQWKKMKFCKTKNSHNEENSGNSNFPLNYNPPKISAIDLTVTKEKEKIFPKKAKFSIDHLISTGENSNSNSNSSSYNDNNNQNQRCSEPIIQENLSNDKFYSNERENSNSNSLNFKNISQNLVQEKSQKIEIFKKVPIIINIEDENSNLKETIKMGVNSKISKDEKNDNFLHEKTIEKNKIFESENSKKSEISKIPENKTNKKIDEKVQLKEILTRVKENKKLELENLKEKSEKKENFLNYFGLINHQKKLEIELDELIRRSKKYNSCPQIKYRRSSEYPSISDENDKFAFKNQENSKTKIFEENSKEKIKFLEIFNLKKISTAEKQALDEIRKIEDLEKELRQRRKKILSGFEPEPSQNHRKVILKYPKYVPHCQSNKNEDENEPKILKEENQEPESDHDLLLSLLSCLNSQSEQQESSLQSEVYKFLNNNLKNFKNNNNSISGERNEKLKLISTLLIKYIKELEFFKDKLQDFIK